MLYQIVMFPMTLGDL